jgi:uncharacterized protein
MDTPTFQRLHSVKQLGFANLVYPGADYSRFSHCVGTCHVIGRMISRLYDRKGRIKPADVDEIQKFRLAGLLHDVGHYPFSHATEHAIENFFTGPKKVGASFALDHEGVGAKLLQHDEALRKAIRNGDPKHPYDPDEIAHLFDRNALQPYTNLLSSDLDADRLDYLCRTSHFAGLPYGSIDLDYIVTQLCEDNEGNPALTDKAVRAADHFLIARGFDYRQVAYHRTVAAFEWLLQDVLTGLLKSARRKHDWSAKGIVTMIKAKKWPTFTDSFVLELIQGELRKAKPFKDPLVAKQAVALIGRRPPSLVAEIEEFRNRHDNDAFAEQLKHIKSKVPEWAKTFKVPEHLWCVWDKEVKLTEIGASHVEDDEDAELAIRIVRKHGTKATPIVNLRESLMTVMADHNIAMIRVYVLLPRGSDKRAKIGAAIRSECPGYHWVQPA